MLPLVGVGAKLVGALKGLTLLKGGSILLWAWGAKEILDQLGVLDFEGKAELKKTEVRMFLEGEAQKIKAEQNKEYYDFMKTQDKELSERLHQKEARQYQRLLDTQELEVMAQRVLQDRYAGGMDVAAGLSGQGALSPVSTPSPNPVPLPQYPIASMIQL